MRGTKGVRLLLAAWAGFALLAGLAFSQSQSADLKGKVKDVSYKLEQVHFTVVAQDDKKEWQCWAGTKEDPGTPDKMDKAGWNKGRAMESRMKGGVVEIHGAGTKDGPITVETLTLTNKKITLPAPNYPGTVAVVCTQTALSPPR